MTQAILNRVTEWNLREVSLEQQAMWLASDYFRKMGKMEVQECLPELDRRYPELMKIVREQYPHRL